MRCWPGPRVQVQGSPSPSLNLGFPHPLCILSPCPLPQGGGYALAVSGQLQVIRSHFEEVQQVRAAGDLHGQSHEAVEVLGERALAALRGTLPIKPPGCWAGNQRPMSTLTQVQMCVERGVGEQRRGPGAGAGEPAEGLRSCSHPGGAG